MSVSRILSATAIGSLFATFTLLFLAIVYKGMGDTGGYNASQLHDQAAGFAVLGLIFAAVCVLSTIAVMGDMFDSPAATTTYRYSQT